MQTYHQMATRVVAILETSVVSLYANTLLWKRVVSLDDIRGVSF